MNDNNQCVSNVQAALDAGRALGSTPITTDKPTAVVVIPNNYKAEALEKHIEKYLPAPRRVQASPTFANVVSFILYVSEYKNADTKIFASVPTSTSVAPSFIAIIDYHSVEGAAWCEHRARYGCEFTEEWKRWMSKNGTRMSQVEFATLLEENQRIITRPPGAELLELVQTLEGKNDIRCNSLIRLSSGKAKLLYEEDVELKGTINTQQGQVEFPTSIEVAIAPFDGGPAYKITCRLRYRIENRRLSFWYECVDVHLIIQECVKEIVERVEEKLSLEVLLGTP